MKWMKLCETIIQCIDDGDNGATAAVHGMRLCVVGH